MVVEGSQRRLRLPASTFLLVMLVLRTVNTQSTLFASGLHQSDNFTKSAPGMNLSPAFVGEQPRDQFCRREIVQHREAEDANQSSGLLHIHDRMGVLPL